MARTLTLIQPDDWHLHLRDGAGMCDVLKDSAARFGRAIVMPNLKPAVTTTAEAEAYRARILAALPAGSAFEPLMTLYLTAQLTPDEIFRAKASGLVYAVKHYPAGATTNSDAGVVNLLDYPEILAALQEADLPLLVHGEVVDPAVDIFDREKVYLDTILSTVIARYPRLRVVLEHVTTEDGVKFVQQAPDTVAATLTAHHLLLNRNAMLVGGMRPHHYCLPVLKRERHRQALLAAATSGHPRFFLGTDSAPHPQHLKESSCGCAGMYTAHAAIELYAEAFDSVGALARLEGFASCFGPDFYRLPRNTGTITLQEAPWNEADSLPFGSDHLVPFRAGGVIPWRLVSA